MNEPASTPLRHTDRALDDLFEEITAKIQAGEPVDLEAYAREFPEQAARLRQLLPFAAVLDPKHLQRFKN